jgi:hypothetical protein
MVAQTPAFLFADTCISCGIIVSPNPVAGYLIPIPILAS